MIDKVRAASVWKREVELKVEYVPDLASSWQSFYSPRQHQLYVTITDLATGRGLSKAAVVPHDYQAKQFDLYLEDALRAIVFELRQGISREIKDDYTNMVEQGLVQP